MKTEPHLPHHSSKTRTPRSGPWPSPPSSAPATASPAPAPGAPSPPCSSGPPRLGSSIPPPALCSRALARHRPRSPPRHPRRHHRRPRIRPQRSPNRRHRRSRRPAHHPPRLPLRSPPRPHLPRPLPPLRHHQALPVRQLESLPEGWGIVLDDVGRRAVCFGYSCLAPPLVLSAARPWPRMPRTPAQSAALSDPHIDDIVPAAALPLGEVELHGARLGPDGFGPPAVLVDDQPAQVLMSRPTRLAFARPRRCRHRPHRGPQPLRRQQHRAPPRRPPAL